MANLRLTQLRLKPWPGPVNFHAGIPNQSLNSKCGWDNTNDNFSTADATARACNANRTQRLGEHRAAYTDNTNCPGWYVMTYLCLHSFEDGMDISKDFSNGHLFHAPYVTTNLCMSNSEWSDTSELPGHVVIRCTTGCDITKGGCQVAIPCSTYTYSDGTGVYAAGYGDGYGWFWTGGVCPCKEITIMDDGSGNYKGVDLTVDGALHKGAVYLCTTGAAALLMSCDQSNVNDTDTTSAMVGPQPAAMAIGWCCMSAA